MNRKDIHEGMILVFCRVGKTIPQRGNPVRVVAVESGRVRVQGLNRDDMVAAGSPFMVHPRQLPCTWEDHLKSLQVWREAEEARARVRAAAEIAATDAVIALRRLAPRAMEDVTMLNGEMLGTRRPTGSISPGVSATKILAIVQEARASMSLPTP